MVAWPPGQVQDKRGDDRARAPRHVYCVCTEPEEVLSRGTIGRRGLTRASERAVSLKSESAPYVRAF